MLYVNYAENPATPESLTNLIVHRVGMLQHSNYPRVPARVAVHPVTYVLALPSLVSRSALGCGKEGAKVKNKPCRALATIRSYFTIQKQEAYVGTSSSAPGCRMRE